MKFSPAQLVHLWPGLVQLQTASALELKWRAAGLGVLFGMLCNVALAATFVWTDWISGPSWWLVWTATVACFLLGSYWKVEPANVAEETSNAEEIYRRALTQYLRRNWAEAEVALSQLVKRHPQHIAGRLLRVALFRRTDRLTLAERELGAAETLPNLRGWRLEIAQERKLLAELREEENPTEEPAPETTSEVNSSEPDETLAAEQVTPLLSHEDSNQAFATVSPASSDQQQHAATQRAA